MNAGFRNFRLLEVAYNIPMRRLLTFAAFLLIISIVPVCAQRGGGHGAAGGGHAGGFGGGHASGGGAHFGSGLGGGHIGGGFAGHSGFVSHGATGSHFAPHMGSGRYFARNGRFGHSGWGRFGDHDRDHHHHFRNGWGSPYYGYGNGYGYPYYGYPYYSYLPGIDPYWWWDTYPSDDSEQRQLAEESNQQNLDEQQALREQDQDAYAQSRPQPRAPQPAASQQPDDDPKTLLVYRDQHQREVQNYAIVDDVIYVFTPQRTEKVPLAILDIPATIRANEDRGVDFHLPGVSEGQ
jgi:hypothetical protein